MFVIKSYKKKCNKIYNKYLSTFMNNLKASDMMGKLSQIPTPTVVIDSFILENNIINMQEKADNNNVQLCPHIKTHKSIKIGQVQLAAGATGVTCSKNSEAAVFMNAKFPRICLAYPIIDPYKAQALIECAQINETKLSVIVDSLYGIQCYDYALSGMKNKSLDILIKVDTGLHRCGVQPNAENVNELIKEIKQSKHLNFIGLLSHGGHSYKAQNKEQVLEMANDETKLLTHLMNNINYDKANLICSVGATPMECIRESYENVTEIRPGNYVFYDLTCLRKGLITEEQIALTILSTVVSVNDDYYIIDAGSKVLSSDQGAHGTSTPGYGLAYPLESYLGMNDPNLKPLVISGLSEEHGWIDRYSSTLELNIGDRVRIIPQHSCPVVNLSSQIYLYDKTEDSGQLMLVDARGCTF